MSQVPIVNAITVDVEDYFHAEAMSVAAPRDRWDTFPRRVVENTNRLFDLFDEAGVRTTMFFLGWVADRHPELVRRAAAGGHEIACHSYWHKAVFRLTADEFREDTRRAKQTLEDISGQVVYGYRAPSFSITKSAPWAHDVLEELGFSYDSSINPVRHGFYGNHEAPTTPYRISDRMLELPITTFVLGNQRLPAGGGAYLRILPYKLVDSGIRQMNRRHNVPAMIYLHPWEIDPEQPRLAVSAFSRFRHYTALDRMEGKLKRLLSSFKFSTVRDTFLRAEATAL